MKSWKRELLKTGIYILVVLGITYLIIHFVGQRTKVRGDSMYPTMHDGDNLIVDKISYRFNEPKRFDIIVFHPVREKEDVYYIKRVIGLPNERVRIDENGYIYINGERLTESYGYQVITDPGVAIEEIQLNEDEYFVLGDNRNASTDSRSLFVGNVHKDTIIGKAWLKIWPIGRFGFVKHK